MTKAATAIWWKHPRYICVPGDFADIYADWIASDDIYDQKYYRSVHYILKYRGMYLEVQVRTLFEEGWGEIDHHILYPYKKQNPMLTEFSELLNRLAGMGGRNGFLFTDVCKMFRGMPFWTKKSMVDVRREYETHETQVGRIELEKIETVQDAIDSILAE